MSRRRLHPAARRAKRAYAAAWQEFQRAARAYARKTEAVTLEDASLMEQRLGIVEERLTAACGPVPQTPQVFPVRERQKAVRRRIARLRAKVRHELPARVP